MCAFDIDTQGLIDVTNENPEKPVKHYTSSR